MDKYLWEHIQVFLSRDDFLNLRETSQFHAACEWDRTRLDCNFVATCPHSTPTGLGTDFGVCAEGGQEETSFQHLVIPAERNGCISSPGGRNDFGQMPTEALLWGPNRLPTLAGRWANSLPNLESVGLGKVIRHQEWPSKHFASLLRVKKAGRR